MVTIKYKKEFNHAIETIHKIEFCVALSTANNSSASFLSPKARSVGELNTWVVNLGGSLSARESLPALGMGKAVSGA